MEGYSSTLLSIYHFARECVLYTLTHLYNFSFIMDAISSVSIVEAGQ